ncbi:hypothetical protein [Jiangella sp. DSM 45060]|uniref:hypothetical protein n=1 Tax=Jiangella sp. DSM 45060 TaxID=1798224 RepID=UPI00087980BB|nr:hypothetical protein [Jiangella sp. DSM 45060]SDT37320.1 hypothetical protein SAMN04515669_3766 [Jiangella sp. DSM 45060]
MTTSTEPGPIREAWQILASAAYILDTPTRSLHDLLALAVVGDAMDALVDGQPTGQRIDVGDHAPHPPHQAARCALAILDHYSAEQVTDQVRVARSVRILRTLVDDPPTGTGRP